jgi:hypothetical protein
MSKQRGSRGFSIPSQLGQNTKLLIMQGLKPRADDKLLILKGLLLKMSCQRTYG